MMNESLAVWIVQYVLIPVGSAVMGAVVTGRYMLRGQTSEFRHQSKNALRALTLEVNANHKYSTAMVNRTEIGYFNFPDPDWLRRSVWDGYLYLLTDLLEEQDLDQLADAYDSLSVLSRMFRNPQDGSYEAGGWVETELKNINEKFRDAQAVLSKYREDSAQTRLVVKLCSPVVKKVRSLCSRI